MAFAGPSDVASCARAHVMSLWTCTSLGESHWLTLRIVWDAIRAMHVARLVSLAPGRVEAQREARRANRQPNLYNRFFRPRCGR